MKKVYEDATIREESGIIVYDPTDDGNDDERNDPVFTQEYMLEFARKHDAEIGKNKRIDRLMSIGVILGIVMFAALLVWLKF